MKLLHLFTPFFADYARTLDTLPNALQSCLNKAAVTPTRAGSEPALAALFGWQADTALPVAALTQLADGIANTDLETFWLRADPVHLHPDQQFLRLFDASVLNIQPEEVQTLIEVLNPFYADTDAPLAFIAAHPEHWYLQLAHHQNLHTHSLHAVRGLPVNDWLPTGEDARWWHTRGNEIQMLLYQQSLNDAREAQGQFSINSLWFWGEGRLPAPLNKSLSLQVFADDVLSQGLARWRGSTASPLPADAQALLEDAHEEVLCVLPAPTATDWAQQLEQHWFAPLLAALKQRAVQTVCWYPGNGRVYCLSGARLWAFWAWRKRGFS